MNIFDKTCLVVKSQRWKNNFDGELHIAAADRSSQKVKGHQQKRSRGSGRPSGVLHGRDYVAAFRDAALDLLQVSDVCQDAVDVQDDGGQLAALGLLLLLHVLQPRPQLILHLFLSAGQRLLQLPQLLFIHRIGAVWRQENKKKPFQRGKRPVLSDIRIIRTFRLNPKAEESATERTQGGQHVVDDSQRLLHGVSALLGVGKRCSCSSRHLQ